LLQRKIDLEKIKALRILEGITQAQMAKHLGLETATGYQYLESGRCSINADRLYVIAQVLGVTVDSLYFAPNTTETVVRPQAKVG